MSAIRHIRRCLTVAAVAAITAAAPAAAQDDLLVEPVVPSAGPVDFGSPLIGTSSAREFVATNRTDAPLQLAGLTTPTVLVHEGLFDLELGACSATLDPGASCRFTVLWRPFEIGPIERTLALEVAIFETQPTRWNGITNIVARGGGRSIDVPDAVEFGSRVVETIGSTRSLTVRTEVPAWVASPDLRVKVVGAHRADFVVDADDCTAAPLDRGCAIALRFAPSDAGPRHASLVVTDAASGDVRTVELTGEGEPRRTEPVAVEPPSASPPVALAQAPGAAPAATPVAVTQAPAAARGPAPAIGHVTCRTVARRRVCAVALADPSSRVRYRVSRAGRIVARGTLSGQRARVRFPRRLRHGRYVLRLQAGGTVVRRTIAL